MLLKSDRPLVDRMAGAYVQPPGKGARACSTAGSQRPVFKGRHYLAMGNAAGCLSAGGLGSTSVNTQVATTGSEVRLTPTSISSVCGDVLACVTSQERLEKLLPRFVYPIVFGVFAILVLTARHRDTLGEIISAAITFFIARLIARGVRALLLEPSRRIRYNRAVAKLRAQLGAAGDIAVGPFSWTLGAPGAMGTTRGGEVIILERGQGYAPLRLAPHQIVDVRVERQSQQVTQTHHSGRTSIAGVSGSLGIAHTLGGSSTSVTRNIEEYVLEIRYQLERNGTVSTVVIPGGTDRRVVEELCATIRRLEA